VDELRKIEALGAIMATSSDSDVEGLVQRILAEVDTPSTPTIDLLRAQAAGLSPAQQSELIDRARRKNLPILQSNPSPPSPGMKDRMRSIAGA
jgi:hypothetical protein